MDFPPFPLNIFSRTTPTTPDPPPPPPPPFPFCYFPSLHSFPHSLRLHRCQVKDDSTFDAAPYPLSPNMSVATLFVVPLKADRTKLKPSPLPFLPPKPDTFLPSQHTLTECGRSFLFILPFLATTFPPSSNSFPSQLYFPLPVCESPLEPYFSFVWNSTRRVTRSPLTCVIFLARLFQFFSVSAPSLFFDDFVPFVYVATESPFRRLLRHPWVHV